MQRNTALLTATIVFVVLSAGAAGFWFVYMLEYDDQRLALQSEEDRITELRSVLAVKKDEYQKLTEEYNGLVSKIEALNRKLADNRRRREQAKAEALAAIERVGPAVTSSFNAYRQGFVDIEQEDRRLEREKQEFKDAKDRLERDIARVQRELKRKQSEHESEAAFLKADIQKVKRQLAEVEQKLELLRKRRELADVLEEDGKIIAVGRGGTNYVAINLGYSDSVRESMKFDVFEERGSGVKVRKAKIEIVQVHASTSDCTILPPMRRHPVCPQCGWEAYRDDMRYCIYCALGDNNDEVQNLDKRVRGVIVAPQDPFNPIVPGDKISNPFYYKGRQMKFVFAGEPVRRSRREIELFIEENGGILEDEIKLDTDYLIVGTGKRVPDMLKQARAKGVKVMQEEELYEFFGRPDE